MRGGTSGSGNDVAFPARIDAEVLVIGRRYH